MIDYPGKTSNRLADGMYQLGRKLAKVSGYPETAHHLGFGALKLLDHVPDEVARTLFGNEAFYQWMDEQGAEFHLGKIPLRSSFILPAGAIKLPEELPRKVLKALGITATIGGITPHPRKGSEQPRIRVNSAQGAIQNCMGLNGRGVDDWATNLSYEMSVLGHDFVPLIANVANDPNTPLADRPKEAKELAKKIGPYVHAIEYNASCPNVGKLSGERAFSGESLEALVLTLAAIHEGIREIGKGDLMPILLKLPPHLDQQALDRIIEATGEFVTGYTCINTSPSRDMKMAAGFDGDMPGGVSGLPLEKEMLRTVSGVNNALGGEKRDIIAVGGLGFGNQNEAIRSGQRAIEAGATLVSGYSGVVLKGLGRIWDISAGAVDATRRKN